MNATILIVAAALLAVLAWFDQRAPTKSTKESPAPSAVQVPSLQAQANAGDVAAMLALARDATGASPPNQAGAFTWLLKAARAGSIDAAYDVGVRYKDGNGVRKHFEESQAWMAKAAEAGHLQARFRMVSKWHARDRISELRTLGELGVKEATVALANELYFGTTESPYEVFTPKPKFLVAPDKNKAQQVLLPLANAGMAEAQRLLAEWGESQGTPKPSAPIREDWWAQLARQTDADELYEAGRHFLRRNERVYKLLEPARLNGRVLTFEESNAKALEWFDKSAQLGNTDAMLDAAELHESGFGTYKNEVASFRLRMKAAEAGSPKGQVAVARAYLSGTGVAKDRSQGFDWAMKAATHPTASAEEMAAGQNLVGWFYAYWGGVEKDQAIGYAWANVAATAGNEDAKRLRSNLEREMEAEDLLEGQRMSSRWKLGEKMARSDARSGESSAKAPGQSGTAAKVAVQGSGFFVSLMGDIVTNHHVVNGCSEIRLPALAATATLVVADQANDLAVIRTASKPASVPALTDSSKVKQGQDVVVFGFPLDGYLPSAGNITPGLVSALAGPGTNSSLIQISAPVQQGNSGGPVLDRRGNVVGVVVGKANAIRVAKVTGDIPQNVNFAISVGTVRSFLEANQIAFDNTSWWKSTKDASDLADAARGYTVKIECVK